MRRASSGASSHRQEKEFAALRLALDHVVAGFCGATLMDSAFAIELALDPLLQARVCACFADSTRVRGEYLNARFEARLLRFSRLTGEWTCGQAAGKGLVAALSEVWQSDRVSVTRLIYEEIGTYLIEAVTRIGAVRAAMAGKGPQCA
jgi:hypothetical protein